MASRENNDAASRARTHLARRFGGVGRSRPGHAEAVIVSNQLRHLTIIGDAAMPGWCCGCPRRAGNAAGGHRHLHDRVQHQRGCRDRRPRRRGDRHRRRRRSVVAGGGDDTLFVVEGRAVAHPENLRLGWVRGVHAAGHGDPSTDHLVDVGDLSGTGVTRVDADLGLLDGASESGIQRHRRGCSRHRLPAHVRFSGRRARFRVADRQSHPCRPRPGERPRGLGAGRTARHRSRRWERHHAGRRHEWYRRTCRHRR